MAADMADEARLQEDLNAALANGTRLDSVLSVASTLAETLTASNLATRVANAAQTAAAQLGYTSYAPTAVVVIVKNSLAANKRANQE